MAAAREARAMMARVSEWEELRCGVEWSGVGGRRAAGGMDWVGGTRGVERSEHAARQPPLWRPDAERATVHRRTGCGAARLA